MRRGLRPKRARGAVLWGLACFAVLQLSLAVAIECGMWRYRDPYYAHRMAPLRRRAAEDASGPRRRLVVMLGSSQTGHGLKGTTFEERVASELGERWQVSNFGVPGAGPLVQLVNYRRLRAEGVRPDYVLVEVMPLMYAEPPFYETTLIKPERLGWADLDVLRSCGMPTEPTLRRDWWQNWPIPWYAHRFSILSVHTPMFLPANLQQNWAARCDATGWVPMPPDPRTSPEAIRAMLERVRAQYQPILRDFRIAAPARAAVRALLADCRREGIPCALVQMPVAATYRSWYAPHCLAQIDALLSELRTEFGVPVLDGRCWVPDDEFPDYYHLLPKGAETFSRRLAQEVAPLLREGGRPALAGARPLP